eukprot:4802452-Lingulodinium_polyedra.AAC.1
MITAPSWPLACATLHLSRPHIQTTTSLAARTLCSRRHRPNLVAGLTSTPRLCNAVCRPARRRCSTANQMRGMRAPRVAGR